MNAKLNPYLNFDGNAAEAMNYYHSVLGGELMMQTFGDQFPDSPNKDRVLHALLVSGDIRIMASDTDPEYKDQPFVAGTNVHLSLVGTDEARLTECFNKLAEGGEVRMPLEKQFWGAIYGQLTDRFGVHWMVNIEPASE